MFKLIVMGLLICAGIAVVQISRHGVPFLGHVERPLVTESKATQEPAHAFATLERPQRKSKWVVPKRRFVNAIVSQDGQTKIFVDGEFGMIGAGDWWGDDYILGIFSKGAKLRTPDGDTVVVRFVFHPSQPQAPLEAPQLPSEGLYVAGGRGGSPDEGGASASPSLSNLR